MKKSIFCSIALVTVFFLVFSCKENSKEIKGMGNEVEEVKQTGNEVLGNGEDLTSEVPSFENSAVQDYVNSYEDYLDEYAKAVENKDIDALSNLGPKGQQLAIKAQEISEDISVEDAQKFTHYMSEKAKMIQELALKTTK